VLKTLGLYKYGSEVRDEVAQKVVMSLELTDRVMEWINHLRELAPC